jgi:hypothetical protein
MGLDLKRNILIFFLLVLFTTSVLSQTKWSRKQRTQQDLQLFHSTYLINLPTAETLQKGDFEFEISHRFVPPVSEGGSALYGFDGPVNMRIALGYAPTNRFIATLGRSNINDNVDLQLKYKALQIRNTKFPILVTINAGGAYNSQLPVELSDNSKKYQYYGQLVVNTLFGKKLGLGIVPAYLYNAHIYCADTEYAFTLGNYAQYYVSPLWSVVAEWIPTVSGWRQYHNSFSLGIELETGGHFFKVFGTNNQSLNHSQYMSGADLDFDEGDWRIGFMITRVLKFN